MALVVCVRACVRVYACVVLAEYLHGGNVWDNGTCGVCVCVCAYACVVLKEEMCGMKVLIARNSRL